MVTIRNWRDIVPQVQHESAIVWYLFREKGIEGYTDEEAPLEGVQGFTLHAMQGRQSGDYHLHEDREQVYYFIKGHGKMKLDDKIHEVREGDAVHIPSKTRHQLINDGDDWIEHVLLSAYVNR